MCTYKLSPVYLNKNNCPIILPYLSFQIFFRYLSSHKVARKNIVKINRNGAQPIEDEENFSRDKGLFNENIYVQSWPMMSWEVLYPTCTELLHWLCLIFPLKTNPAIRWNEIDGGKGEPVNCSKVRQRKVPMELEVHSLMCDFLLCDTNYEYIFA